MALVFLVVKSRMKKKSKPNLGRSPLPKQKGGPHKTPFDYDRRKWKEIAADEAEKPQSEQKAEAEGRGSPDGGKTE